MWNTVDMKRKYSRKKVQADVDRAKPYTKRGFILRMQYKVGLTEAQAEQYFKTFESDPRIETDHGGPLGMQQWYIPQGRIKEFRSEVAKAATVDEEGHQIKQYKQGDLASLQQHVWRQDLTLGDVFFQGGRDASILGLSAPSGKNTQKQTRRGRGI